MVVTTNIRATRMELLNYRKRLKLAERGYKLLKDKRDKLMANLYPLLDEEGRNRKNVEEKLARVYRLMTIARSKMEEKELKGTFPYANVNIAVTHENLFGIMIPKIDYNIEEKENYSLATLPICAEDAVNGFKDIIKDLMELTELEAKCELLAMEIEKTKRRVNALEHVLIPEITANIRYIEMKIEEMERSETVNRIKMKEMKKK